jgi:hypothetical protein
MFQKRFILIALFVLTGMLNPGLQAQCKSFTKKKCMPGLAPFLSNGQLNTATMLPGQSADMIMNFNSGMSYRIIVCGEGVLGQIEFQVSDASGRVLFMNKSQDYAVDSWDFAVETTTQLTITVKVPDQPDKTVLLEEGCVSVIVGFKK